MNALVTGGTRGIGKAISQALENAGHHVVSIGRNENLLNVTSRSTLISRVVSELGGIDILVNNAGAQSKQKAIIYSQTQFKKDFELMVNAPFDLSQQAARYMLVHGGGHIINILSTAAFQGARNISGYVIAKHALLGMTRALAVEFAPLIHVNAVAPGLIDTDMTSEIDVERKALLNSITPAGRFGNPDEVADAVMFLVRNKFMYGQVVTVDGGWMVKNG